MNPETGSPTLEQLRVLIAVAEIGSFAGAARKLRRVTSVVSYTIANLEAQLGVRLFDRQATKRPQLTEAGRMVVREARQVVSGADTLRARTTAMVQGLEPELSVVLDTFLPENRLVDALTAFSATFPTVLLHLSIETLGAVTQSVLDRRASLGVSGPLGIVDEVERVAIDPVELVPVSATGHPLASSGSNFPGAGRDHIQLVLTDRSPLTSGQDFGVMSPRTWRLADLSSKHMLLKAGIGWGYMPEPMVREDLAASRLTVLDMPDMPRTYYAMHVIYRRDTSPGPAAAWLIERLRGQLRRAG